MTYWHVYRFLINHPVHQQIIRLWAVQSLAWLLRAYYRINATLKQCRQRDRSLKRSKPIRIKKDYTMRKAFAMAVGMKFLKVLIAVLSCISFLFAQENSSPTKEQDRIKAHEQAEQKAAELIIHGKVVSVNLIANTIIVETRRAQDTLVVESGAKIMLGNMELSKGISLGDLFTGDKVTVTWELIDGKKSAAKIVKESAFDTKEQLR
jgi:hypothetical protein